MESITHLWIEDRKEKSGYIFWKILFHYLNPSIIVESKRNNTELVKAVASLQDTENRYIILFDNSFDNVQIYQEIKKLQECAKLKKNVILMDIFCFEYILLEFDSLIKWVFAPDDPFLERRSIAISARNKLIEILHSGETNYKILNEIIAYDKNLENHNIEQLCAKLLFDITRNTGFEVSKGKLGECWITSCCKWLERQEDDICGLDNHRLSTLEKMNLIYQKTSLLEKFSQIGLEVLDC